MLDNLFLTSTIVIGLGLFSFLGTIVYYFAWQATPENISYVFSHIAQHYPQNILFRCGIYLAANTLRIGYVFVIFICSGPVLRLKRIRFTFIGLILNSILLSMLVSTLGTMEGGKRNHWLHTKCSNWFVITFYALGYKYSRDMELDRGKVLKPLGVFVGAISLYFLVYENLVDRSHHQLAYGLLEYALVVFVFIVHASISYNFRNFKYRLVVFEDEQPLPYRPLKEESLSSTELEM